MKKKFFIPIIVLIFILLEICLRVFYYEQLKERKFPTIYQVDTIHGYTTIPNAKVEIIYPSQDNCFVLNNQGFIGSDFKNEKPDSVFRIIHVGTSQEANYGIENKQNYNYQIQEIYDSLRYNVEFINMSIDGGLRSLFNFKLIQNKYLEYNPNLILFSNTIPLEAFYYSREIYNNYVIAYGMNNNKSKKRAKQLIDLIEKKKWFTFIYDSSFIFRAFVKKYIENAGFDVNGKNNTWMIKAYQENSIKVSGYHCIFIRLSMDKTAQEFRSLKKELNNDQDIILVNYFDTSQYSNYTNRLKLFSEISGINSICIDINQNDYEQQLSYEHDGHPSSFMHKVIADKLYLELDSLIPNKYKN